MSPPTPGPSVGLGCGCEPCYEGGYGDDGRHGRYSMEWCPLHAKAPEMLEALEAIIYASDQCQGHRSCNHSLEPWQRARALLLELDGEET